MEVIVTIVIVSWSIIFFQMVSNMFHFHPELWGRFSAILMSLFFQMACNSTTFPVFAFGRQELPAFVNGRLCFKVRRGR